MIFSSNEKTVFLLPILCCLLLAVNGCSSKAPERPAKSGGTAGRRTPATQRPYVIKHRTYYPIPSSEGYREKGLASWYGRKFHGRKTASGEIYDMYAHTAAHKTLPMNTMLLVKNLRNGKSTVVRINDRGPFIRNRIIDLSHTAAKELDIINNGTAMVEIVALGEEKKKTAHQEVASGQSARPVRQDFDKGKFYIQVGAFEDKNKARKVARTFADKGQHVIIQQFPAAGISLYRVMVYSGTSLQQARKHKAELEQNGFPNALVIARDKG